MARTSGDDNSWQPLVGAAPGRLRELGRLLMWRRAALGHSYRPAFLAEQDVNGRMVSDIERGRRDNYTGPTLEDLAAAYAVTYDSILAVARGKADELTPVPVSRATGPARRTRARHDDPAGVPPAPFDDPGREQADYPYAVPIWKQFVDMAGEGIAVSGERLFPDSPDDAKAWDGTAGRMDVGDRVWFIADLRRRAAGRGANSGTGTDGA